MLQESEKKTLVVHFGDKQSSGGSLRMAIDPVAHTDKEGSIKSTFAPDEDVYFLIFPSPKQTIVSVKATDGGTVQQLGWVSRTQEEQLTIPSNEPVNLGFIPTGAVSPVRFYGRSGILTTNGTSVTCSAWPCIADITYPAKAIRYRHRFAAGLTVDEGETFPVSAVAEYKEEK